MNRKDADFDSEIEEWFEKTGGIPYLAIALMCYMDAKKLKIDVGRGGEYWPMIGMDYDRAKENLSRIIGAYEALFRLIVEKEFYKVPVILQPTADDELERFYDDFGCRDCLRMLKRRAEVGIFFRSFEEEWEGREVTVYDLNDVSMKLRRAVDVLAENVNWIREEFSKYRRKLVEIMTDKSMETGETTTRMIYHALRHLDELETDEDVEIWYLIWLRHALQELPALGLERASKGIEIAKKRRDVHAWAFLRDLAQKCGFYELKHVGGIMLKLGKALGEMTSHKCTTKDDVLRAFEILTTSKFLLSTFKHLRIADKVLKDFDNILKSAESLRVLKEFVIGWVLRDRADVLIDLNKNDEAKRDLIWILENCSNLKFEEPAKDFFKPYGGNAEEKFERSINDLIASAHYDLGRVLRNLMEFENARKEFELALKIYEKLKSFDNALKCKGFIKRVGVLEGNIEDFTDPFEEMREWLVELDPMVISGICAEYVVSLALKGAYEDLRRDLEPCLGWMFYEDEVLTKGVLAVLGLDLDRRKIIGELKKYDEYVKERMGLNREVESRVELLKDFDDHLVRAELMGWGEGFVRDMAKFFGGSGFLKELIELAKSGKDVRERIELITTADSVHAFARILRLYLEGCKEKAKTLALSKKEYCKDRNPCLSWLFGEVAEALDEGNDERFKSAVVKLFYYHI